MQIKAVSVAMCQETDNHFGVVLVVDDKGRVWKNLLGDAAKGWTELPLPPEPESGELNPKGIETL